MSGERNYTYGSIAVLVGVSLTLGWIAHAAIGGC